MDYELAKQLKDAGFPLLVIEDADNSHRDWFAFENIFYAIPTLEGLIEACGANFYALIRNDEDLKWWARKDRGDQGISSLIPTKPSLDSGSHCIR